MTPDDPVLGDRTMEELDADECLALLSAVSVGRIVLVDDGQPVAIPVNHAVHDGAVVFKSVAGSPVDRAREAGGLVAFEADDATSTAPFEGWSVLVKGTLAAVDDPADLAALERLGVYSWHPALSRREWDRDAAAWVPVVDVRWLRVDAREITGRRTGPA